MAKTLSTMLPLGTSAPEFTLLDTKTHKMVSLSALKSNQATVIMFICNHCPFVKHIKQALITFAQDYQTRGVAIIAISANDVIHYPEDSPEKMQEEGYPFPYLYDETQQIAKAYQAACTPDFYVFDKDLRCVYRGQFDDSRPGNGVPVGGESLRAAVDNLLANKPIDSHQKPSMGCNIKWK